MDEINDRMGTLDGIQVRAEATVLEYFYNNTQVSNMSTTQVVMILPMYSVQKLIKP